jgi:hypothetical protein
MLVAFALMPLLSRLEAAALAAPLIPSPTALRSVGVFDPNSYLHPLSPPPTAEVPTSPSLRRSPSALAPAPAPASPSRISTDSSAAAAAAERDAVRPPRNEAEQAQCERDVWRDVDASDKPGAHVPDGSGGGDKVGVRALRHAVSSRWVAWVKTNNEWCQTLDELLAEARNEDDRRFGRQLELLGAMRLAVYYNCYFGRKKVRVNRFLFLFFFFFPFADCLAPIFFFFFGHPALALLVSSSQPPYDPRPPSPPVRPYI